MMTQKAMSALFDFSPDNIGLHLRNIFKDGELNKSSVTEKYSATASDSKNYMKNFHNLDAVISVVYRVHSIPPMGYGSTSTICYTWIHGR